MNSFIYIIRSDHSTNSGVDQLKFFQLKNKTSSTYP